MPRYIPLTSDYGFKRIFANPDHPHILINFIETVIPTLSIQSVELLDTTSIQPFPDDRMSIFDVYCTLDDGSHVIVEMQNIKQAFYIAIKETAYNDGKEEGIQEGRQEGLEEGIQHVALNLLRSGVDIEIISNTTGLSISQLTDLQSSHSNTDRSQ